MSGFEDPSEGSPEAITRRAKEEYEKYLQRYNALLGPLYSHFRLEDESAPSWAEVSAATGAALKIGHFELVEAATETKLQCKQFMTLNRKIRVKRELYEQAQAMLLSVKGSTRSQSPQSALKPQTPKYRPEPPGVFTGEGDDRSPDVVSAHIA